MNENPGPFITSPTSADFTKSVSLRSRRRAAAFKVYDTQATANKATYYDAIIAAIREGKSEADAMIHAQGVVQAIEEDLKLSRMTALNMKEETFDQSGPEGIHDDSGSVSDSDIEFDDDGNPLKILGKKAESAFGKLQSAMERISTFSSLKGANKKEPVELVNIRVLHKKLDVTIGQYDTIMDRVLEDLEFHMENIFYRNYQEAEDKFRTKLRLQDETLRSHVKCDAQIDALRKENDILKQEMKEMIMKNSQFSSELADLRIYKSNAQAEERLMSEKLANRKTYIKVLTTKVKKLKEILAMKSTDTQDDHTCHESYPSENELTEHEEEVNVPENMDIESDPAEVIKWYMSSPARKPKWNTSGKTNLLKNEIYSIMHNIEYQYDDGATDTIGHNEEDTYQKIDRKYRTQIAGLKFQLESERKEARKVSDIYTKRNHRMKKIINVLKECLSVLGDEQKDTDATVNNSDTKSLSSVSSRLKEVQAIYERKELLNNLIGGLHGQFIDPDCYSSTYKEDSQIYRGSRPSSSGIPSTNDLKISAPIVPIQLKSEKAFKNKKKSNEFHSVKGWLIAAKKRNAPHTHPGIMTVSLIETAIKKDHCHLNSEAPNAVKKPELESIMRQQRPVSARTNISQNSVRFAPTLEDVSSNATFKKPKGRMTPIS